MLPEASCSSPHFPKLSDEIIPPGGRPWSLIKVGPIAASSRLGLPEQLCWFALDVQAFPHLRMKSASSLPKEKVPGALVHSLGPASSSVTGDKQRLRLRSLSKIVMIMFPLLKGLELPPIYSLYIIHAYRRRISKLRTIFLKNHTVSLRRVLDIPPLWDNLGLHWAFEGTSRLSRFVEWQLFPLVKFGDVSLVGSGNHYLHMVWEKSAKDIRLSSLAESSSSNLEYITRMIRKNGNSSSSTTIPSADTAETAPRQQKQQQQPPTTTPAARHQNNNNNSNNSNNNNNNNNRNRCRHDHYHYHTTHWYLIVDLDAIVLLWASIGWTPLDCSSEKPSGTRPSTRPGVP